MFFSPVSTLITGIPAFAYLCIGAKSATLSVGAIKRALGFLANSAFTTGIWVSGLNAVALPSRTRFTPRILASE